MPTTAKICGLTRPEAVAAALEGGASHLGFVFFPKSPRNLSPATAASLAAPARGRTPIVAVVVDPDEALVDAINKALHPDFFQLHGAERVQHAAAIKARTGAGVIKALPVSDAADLDRAGAWDGVADHLMFDARPPKDAVLPGGVGARFDWRLLQGRRFGRPWFLAGGVTPDNVEEALKLTGAPLVDVSSGVESSPGLKDPALISAFLKAVERAR